MVMSHYTADFLLLKVLPTNFIFLPAEETETVPVPSFSHFTVLVSQAPWKARLRAQLY